MDKKSTPRQKRQSKGLEENFWDCSVCTFRNTAEAFKCAMCDVRKGTSTRKPRLNPQLVAQQVAQHMTASTTITPKPQPRREGSKERKQPQGTLSNPEEKVSKKKIRNIRPRLKNVDRSQVHSQPVTVNNVTVVITEYLPKSVASSTSEIPAISTDTTTCPTPNHSEIPNGAHIPPPPPQTS